MIRTRVLGLPDVRAIEDSDALGLVADEGNRRVTGVRVLRRRAGSTEEVMPGDLVVDASGRGSRAPAWLEALDYPRPAEEQMRVGIGYTSRFYRRDPEDPGGDYFAMSFPDPCTRRAGLVAAQEGDRWLVTLIGYLGEHAPTDERGFLAYARSLPASDIYEVIKDAEPLTALVPMRFPTSQRRRYERLARFPDGLVVTGDALCSFNPVYAQGMTVAALEALTLGTCLAAGGDQLPRRFFRQVTAVVNEAWSVSAWGDLRFPDVEGERTPMVRFINWYLGKLHIAAHDDAVVAAAFQRVVNMLIPTPSVLHPRVALRVLRGNLRPARGMRPGTSISGHAVPRG
jgi:2-polyprenyl-6-methoxyphenol hydroxylase-like FAD-dependent oxidoreductase